MGEATAQPCVPRNQRYCNVAALVTATAGPPYRPPAPGSPIHCPDPLGGRSRRANAYCPAAPGVSSAMRARPRERREHLISDRGERALNDLSGRFSYRSSDSYSILRRLRYWGSTSTKRPNRNCSSAGTGFGTRASTGTEPMIPCSAMDAISVSLSPKSPLST